MLKHWETKVLEDSQKAKLKQELVS